MVIKKPMRNMLIALGILFAFVCLYKIIAAIVMHFQFERDGSAVTVATAIASYEDWQSNISAVGNISAINGVDITSEADGMIKEIFVISGQEVKQGDPIVALNTDPDDAVLASLEAQAKLSQLVYERGLAQFKFNAISKETLEENEYTMKMDQAAVDEQKALIEQKKIVAPFEGTLGILYLQVGQFISAGDPLITLQQLNPLFVYFYLPERYVPELSANQTIEVRTDSFPGKVFKGKITAFNPIIDESTRNIAVEALIDNPKMELLPGMFARINVLQDKEERYLTVPQAAISYNPYGDLVYVVKSYGDEKQKEEENDDENKASHAHDTVQSHHKTKPKKSKKLKDQDLIVVERFVQTGKIRGDQVAILKGLEEGEEVVVGGQLKLRNNAEVVIDNSVLPSNNAHPDLPDDRE